MPGARRMPMVILGLLFPAAVCADDAKVADTDDRALPPARISTASFLERRSYSSRWQSTRGIEVSVPEDDGLQPVGNFEFRDSGVLARLSELRNLSLLTLAEVGKARLFIGVNDDGLIGLHFNALARQGDRQYMEMIRMPYLKADGPGTTPEPASR